MRRFIIILSSLFLLPIFALILPPGVFRSSNFFLVDGGNVSTTGFTFTNNLLKGYLTAENENVKVVWHYKILSTENSNRGGGNIYELYHKATDPGMQRNLVSIWSGGGGKLTSVSKGIGGLGSTYMYSDPGSGASGDNGTSARVLSKDFYLDGDNAVFEISLIVSSVVDNSKDDYRVDKKWTVSPSGVISLSTTSTILRDFLASEPTYSFSFSQNYGWTTASYFGHPGFQPAKCAGVDGVGNHNNLTGVIGNIDTIPPAEYGIGHAQQFTLSGQTNGVEVKVSMDNNGKGFENGGLFSFGNSMWDVSHRPASSVEYVNRSSGEGGYGNNVHWYGWWGGGSPKLERYRPVPVGASWSDTMKIEMSAAATVNTPVLTIRNTGIQWASYSDYVNNMLTVEFSTTNAGSEVALSAAIVAATASSGVEAFDTSQQFGDIPIGETRLFLVIYKVPRGISVFRTNIYLTAIDARGNQVYFPMPPPG